MAQLLLAGCVEPGQWFGKIGVQVLRLQQQQGQVGRVAHQAGIGLRFLNRDAVRRVVGVQIEPLQRGLESQPGVEQVAGVGMDDAQTQGLRGRAEGRRMGHDALRLRQCHGAAARSHRPQRLARRCGKKIVAGCFCLVHCKFVANQRGVKPNANAARATAAQRPSVPGASRRRRALLLIDRADAPAADASASNSPGCCASLANALDVSVFRNMGCRSSGWGIKEINVSFFPKALYCLAW